MSTEASASGGDRKEVAIEVDNSTAEEGAPAKKVAKRTVEDAAAVILAAMNKKTVAKAALKRPAAASSKPPTSEVTAADAKRPSYSVEWSRNQVLYRSGLKGPNQHYVFKFKNDKEREAAVSKAKKMVEAERKRMGLAIGAGSTRRGLQ